MVDNLPTQSELDQQMADAAYQRLLKGDRVSLDDLHGNAIPLVADKIAKNGRGALVTNGSGNQTWFTLAPDRIAKNNVDQLSLTPTTDDDMDAVAFAAHLKAKAHDTVDDLMKKNLKGVTFGQNIQDGFVMVRDEYPLKIDTLMRKYVDDSHELVYLANMTSEERATYRSALEEEAKLEKDPTKKQEILGQIEWMDFQTSQGQEVLETALKNGTDAFRQEMRDKYPNAVAEIEEKEVQFNNPSVERTAEPVQALKR